MAIYKFKTDRFTFWTGDKGAENVHKAFKELVEKDLKKYYNQPLTEDKLKDLRNIYKLREDEQTKD